MTKISSHFAKTIVKCNGSLSETFKRLFFETQKKSIVMLLTLSVYISDIDIGIMINANLSWDDFQQQSQQDAWSLEKGMSPYRTQQQTLYHAFVKSQLCYATEVWSPATAKLQMTLERVQRRATRWILKTNVGEMPYEDRLTTLNQLPLVYYRELRDLVFWFINLSSVVLT